MREAPDPVVVATYDHRHEAELAQSVLENAGIQAAVFPDDIGGLYPVLRARMRLLVPPEDVDRALQALAGWDLPRTKSPVWSARPSAGSGHGRELAAIALLFGGGALIMLDFTWRLFGESNAGVFIGAILVVVGAIQLARAPARPRKAATRRTD